MLAKIRPHWTLFVAMILAVAFLSLPCFAEEGSDPNAIRFNAMVAINDGIREKDQPKISAGIQALMGIENHNNKNPHYWWFLARGYGALGNAEDALRCLKLVVSNGWEYPIGDAIDEGRELHVVAQRFPNETKRLAHQFERAAKQWEKQSQHAHRNLDLTAAAPFSSFEELKNHFEARRDEKGQEYLDHKQLGRRAIVEWQWSVLDEERAAIRRYIKEHPDALDAETAAYRLVVASASYHGAPDTFDFWHADAQAVVAAAEEFQSLYPTGEVEAALSFFDDASVAFMKAKAHWLSRSKPRDKDRKYTAWAWKRGIAQFEEVEKSYPGTVGAAMARIWRIALLFEAQGQPISDEIAQLYAALQQEYSDNAEVQAEIAKHISTVAFMLGGLPEFTFVDLDGKQWTRNDLQGHVVLLDFWATWCTPCVEGLPKIKEVYEAHRENGFIVLGIASEYKDMTQESFKAWLTDQGVSWPQAMFTNDTEEEKKFSALFGVEGVPHYILVDRDGKLVGIATGSAEKLLKQVPDLLTQPREVARISVTYSDPNDVLCPAPRCPFGV